MAAPHIDPKAVNKVVEYMAMGLVYEFLGKQPVMPRFPHRQIGWMDVSDEAFINYIASLNAEPPFEKYLDNGRFNNEIRYCVVSYNQSRVLVYLQIGNPLMVLTSGKQSRIVGISFLSDEEYQKDQEKSDRANKSLEELIKLSEELDLYRLM